MEVALLGVGLALAIVVAVTAGAVIEVFRQLAALRVSLALDDLASPLDIKSGEFTASDIGLPRQLMDEPAAIAVFLSPKCGTCLAIAESFRSGAPDNVWFVLLGEDRFVPAKGTERSRWEALASAADRVVTDPTGSIASRMGLEITPAVLTLRFGEVVRGHAVSSPRQVTSLVPSALPRGFSSLDEGEFPQRTEPTDVPTAAV
jgi:hypothetical protein